LQRLKNCKLLHRSPGKVCATNNCLFWRHSICCYIHMPASPVADWSSIVDATRPQHRPCAACASEQCCGTGAAVMVGPLLLLLLLLLFLGLSVCGSVLTSVAAPA
jgi:hypothetical protein